MMLVAILITLTLTILLFAFFIAFVLLEEEEWPGKGWLWDSDPWDTLCEEGCALCDAARAEVDERDLAGDGSDEGLVRERSA